MNAANRSLPAAVLLALAACGRPAVSPATRSAHADEASTLIRNVRLFDGERVTERTSVVIEGERIAAVGAQLTANAAATVLDGEGKTLLPGLIDSHTHCWEEGHLESALRFGVTTELDMMTEAETARRLKVASAKRRDLADLRSAGSPVTSPGGHGTEYGFKVPTLTRPEEAPAFVAARIGEGSDYIKIIYTPDLPVFRSIPREVLEASVRAAHDQRRMAIVHVDSLREGTDALMAGADGLAHLFHDQAATPELVALAVSHNAFVVPTLSVLRAGSGDPYGPVLVRDPTLGPKIGEPESRTLVARFPLHFAMDHAGIARSVQRLRDASVPILAGTDAPNPGTAHGVSLHGEMSLLVEAGLTPVEALRAATSAPARAFSLRDRGRIEKGLRADLLLVDGDPTRDIAATRKIAAVWKQGHRLIARAPVRASEKEVVKAPPPKRPLGIISDFESARAGESTFGTGWATTTDEIMGGRSKATMQIVARHGATGKALAVRGTVAPDSPQGWSGVMFNPGDKLFAPADLSDAKELVFTARGDGKRYSVLIFNERRGPEPKGRSFVAGSAWREIRMPLSSFAAGEPNDVTGIAIVAGPDAGDYAFELDDVALR